MPILYRFEEDGSFVAGDTRTGFAARLAATQRHTEQARQTPEIVALELIEAERGQASARQGREPVNEAIRENDARFIAALEAGLADGSTRVVPGPESSPSEIVQQAEARHGVRFDGWEVSHVIEWRNIEYQSQPNFCEPLEATNFDTIEDARLQDDYVSDFWTVYGHLPQGGVDAIEDFPTEERARDFLAGVTGDRYADNTYPNHTRNIGGTEADLEANPFDALANPAPGDDELRKRLTAEPDHWGQPLSDLENALQAVEGPDLRQLGERAGGQVIDWPTQPDTYHGQRDDRAAAHRPIEPAARLLEALRAGMGEQGATVTNYASQERGGLEPGDRVFLAPRSADWDR